MPETAVKALADPKLGDESVAYSLGGDIEGESLPMTFMVVRSGSTLAAFYAMNVLESESVEIPRPSSRPSRPS